jgi:hypothetical protein
MRRVISLSKILAGPGQSHLFPNEYKHPKTIDLRADTPFTSPPLNDDFDAITQRWSRTTRATTVDPTASHLFDQLDAVTRATTPAVAAFPKPRRKQKGTRGDTDDRVPRKQNGEVGAIVARERSLRRTRGTDRIKASNTNGCVSLLEQRQDLTRLQTDSDGPTGRARL